MFTWRKIRILLPLLCIFAFVWTTAPASITAFTTIDYPNASHTYLLGINPSGDYVGSFDDATGQHGFVYRNGEYTAFDRPNALWTNAYGISPNGDIVGQYGWYDLATDTTTTQGFVLSKGIFYPVEITGQQNNMPFKINPDGLLVGCNHFNTSNTGGNNIATMTGFSTYMFGTAHNTMNRSMNVGVNPSGDIVGYYFATPTGTPSNRAEWSYLLSEGVYTFFQYPGAFATLATDISARGTIVGQYRLVQGGQLHGFTLAKGEFESFDVAGATHTVPFGINSNGDIVGYYQVGTGSSAVYHGFLLSSERGNSDLQNKK